MSNVEITGYNEAFREAYVDLNLEWIRTHFWVEEMDVAQLENPKSLILDPGGEIFFVLEDGKPVGTCAMIPHGPGCYELAKMAVDRAKRGKGFGDLLIETAVDWARKKGASRVMLLSNTALAPAINLYKKHGFAVKHLGQHPDYKRSNIEMELQLSVESTHQPLIQG